MKISSKNLLLALGIGIAVAVLMIVAFNKQLIDFVNNSMQPQVAELEPTPGNPEPQDYEFEAEREVVTSLENQAETILMQKNSWTDDQFYLTLTQVDSKYTMVRIVPVDEQVPEGTALFSTESEIWELIFDSTIPDKCAVLDPDNRYYPYELRVECGFLSIQ